MASRFIDWLTNLTAKSTTIDGTEITHIGSSGLSQKATLANVIRYGGGSTRNETAGNATVTRTTDGAIYLEVTGQTAGNARGAGAFDWQAVRGNAARVASGARAIALGSNNTVSGDDALAIGALNTASAAYSYALGRSCTSSKDDAVTIGFSNTASADRSLAAGEYTFAANATQFAFGGGPALGQAQGNLQTFYTATTDAASTPLNITATASKRMVIPATRSCAFIGIVQAMCNVSSSSNFIKAWEIKGVITRDGNNTTRIVDTPTITVMAQDADGTQTPSTWAIASITADDTNDALAINVTGQTGQTIRWQATVLYSQIGF